jgi:RPA family protein
MSQSESDEEVNRREVAYRLFAAEFDDADFSYAESDEERAPNYVVTPTGARANRVFVVGVLTEVEQVNDDVVRARVVDPTGAFVVYAGQYQPEALAALESAETPSFVAVTGKARTFEPDDSDVVYTSIRPETVSEVDAETRDRWVVTTAERTVDRVATAAAAHERVERGDSLQSVLEQAGVHASLASGIPRALDHYGTTPAYLAAVHDLALGAARVVSGDADSAGELTVRPDQEGDATLNFAADLDIESAPADESAAATEESVAEPDVETEEAATEEETEAADESVEPAEATGAVDEEAAADEAATADESEPAETGSATDASESEESDEEPTAADAEAGGGDGGEMYELSEEERQEVEEEYDVGFSTGDEIPEAGEQDLDAPGPDDGIEPGEGGESEQTVASDGDGEDDGLGDFDAGDDEDAYSEDEADGDEDDDLDDFTEDEYDEPDSDAEDDESPPPDLDLEDYVVDLMAELDDGDGAPRDDVVTTAADDLDADEGEIEEAIQSALMSGRCYESGDDHLKAI